jgi:integral membrane sensor domain MASE1
MVFPQSDSGAKGALRLKDAALVLLVAVVYASASRLGLLMALGHGDGAPVWPATGVAFGALILGGWRLWPGVMLGAAIAYAPTAVPPVVWGGMMVGNTLEALAAVWLATHGARWLWRTRQAAAPLGFALAALVAPALSATAGAGSLWSGGAVPGSVAFGLWRSGR